MRDVMREELAAHYDHEAGFSNSFTIGTVGNICERAFAVASAAVGEATYVRARADVIKGRPTHCGRVAAARCRESSDRRMLDAWVMHSSIDP
jgi:hypothetical protein